MAKERLLRLKEVESRVGMARSSIYRLIDGGQFPRPVKIAARAVRWPETIIEHWIDQKIAESAA